MKNRAALLGLVLLLMSSVASANVVFEVTGTTGGDPNALGIGESVTINIKVTNPQATAVQGLGASVYGYDEGIADFSSGQAALSFFVQFCPSPFTCFGGLDQAINAFFNPAALVESQIGQNGKRVTIANAAALTATSQTGALDQGIDGNVGTTQFSVVFTGVATGETTLQIGTGYTGDGVVLPGGSLIQAVGDTITINVPEPGAAIASLSALGAVLGVVAIRRRA